MPRQVKDAKILLVDSAIEIKSMETDAKIQMSSPEQWQAFMDQEEKMIKDMADKIKTSNASVVFSQKGIDDNAQHYLAKAGIMLQEESKKATWKNLPKQQTEK